jgi:acyl-CoA thioesterase FadM
MSGSVVMFIALSQEPHDRGQAAIMVLFVVKALAFRYLAEFTYDQRYLIRGNYKKLAD